MSESKEVAYLMTLKDGDIEKALHPEVLGSLKSNGYVRFGSEDAYYFIMENDRKFVEPSKRAISDDRKLIEYNGNKTICYASEICGNGKTDNNTVLCKDCVKLFIKNGLYVVDLMDCACCNDCGADSRSIRVHCTNRQLCMPCFKKSLERLRQKREEEMKNKCDGIQRLYMGLAGLFSLVTSNEK